ncbi:MAG TPA: HAMP domain-containing sensor histidine kinase [Anaerolineales bacterium]|nr:HAMP domain-containing sensor histidine kinase [Anaerolineales bacterium]
MPEALRRLMREKYLNLGAKLALPSAITILLVALALSPFGNKILLILAAVLGLATLWIWIATLRIVTRSLAQLAQATLKMSQGDLNQKVDTSYFLLKDEITILSENFNLMVENLSDLYGNLEDQVEQRTQELAEAKDSAVSANRSKSEFVSFVSHELKLPMTSIKGYSDLLLSGMTGALNENQTNFLATIRNNVNRMSALVSDLSDSSRIESGRLRLEGREVPIWDVIDEVVTLLRAQITQKEQTITVDIPGELPKAWADRNRLAQILTNLLNNANQYTPAGGVIRVRATRDHHMIQIEVEDNGFGMEAEDQQKLFSKFFRSADDKVRENPGNGLSLSLTKYLVELQGGEIWCKSEYRKGTSFYFTVPVATDGNSPSS